jgi:hypothetical protein
MSDFSDVAIERFASLQGETKSPLLRTECANILAGLGKPQDTVDMVVLNLLSPLTKAAWKEEPELLEAVRTASKCLQFATQGMY